MRRSLLMFALLAANAVAAQTYVSGPIHTSTTFTPDKNPYNVTGDLIVFEGATLTLAPGVEIIVDSGQKIEIRGAIIAVGTAAKPIYVHGHNAGHSIQYWKGFILTAGGTLGPRADFNWCNVSNASAAFDLDLAYAGPYRFRNSIYSYNTAVNYDGGLGGTFFDSCTFTNNFYGLTAFQYGGKVSNSLFNANAYGTDGVDSVAGCKFSNNTQTGIQGARYVVNNELWSNNVAVSCAFNSCTYTGNKIKSNYVGVRITASSGNNTFTGNELCGNRQYDVDLTTTTDCDLSMNCWCTADSAAIRAKISDGYRTAGKGRVSYIPFNTGCTVALRSGSIIRDDQPVVLSPNPLRAGTSLRLSLARGTAHAGIIVRDITGRIVPHEPVAAAGEVLELRFPYIAPGLYSLAFDRGNGSWSTTTFLVIE